MTTIAEFLKQTYSNSNGFYKEANTNNTPNANTAGMMGPQPPTSSTTPSFQRFPASIPMKKPIPDYLHLKPEEGASKNNPAEPNNVGAATIARYAVFPLPSIGFDIGRLGYKKVAPAVKSMATATRGALQPVVQGARDAYQVGTLRMNPNEDNIRQFINSKVNWDQIHPQLQKRISTPEFSPYANTFNSAIRDKGIQQSITQAAQNALYDFYVPKDDHGVQLPWTPEASQKLIGAMQAASQGKALPPDVQDSINSAVTNAAFNGVVGDDTRLYNMMYNATPANSIERNVFTQNIGDDSNKQQAVAEVARPIIQRYQSKYGADPNSPDYDPNWMTNSEIQSQMKKDISTAISNKFPDFGYYGIFKDPNIRRAIQYIAPWVMYGLPIAGMASMMGNNSLWPLMLLGGLGSGAFGYGGQELFGLSDDQMQGANQFFSTINSPLSQLAQQFFPGERGTGVASVLSPGVSSTKTDENQQQPGTTTSVNLEAASELPPPDDVLSQDL